MERLVADRSPRIVERCYLVVGRLDLDVFVSFAIHDNQKASSSGGKQRCRLLL